MAKSGNPDFTTISAAIAAAASGDTIEILDDAAYTEELDLGAKELVLYAASGPTVAPPSTGHSAPLLRIDQGQTSATRIDGLNFHKARYGAIVLEGTSPEIVNCSFSLNTNYGVPGVNGVIGTPSAERSGAITAIDSSPRISKCQFNDNEAQFSSGGAIRIVGNRGPGYSSEIANCDFRDNRADERGGAIFLYGAVSIAISDSYFHFNLLYSETGLGATDPVGGASLAVIDTGASPVTVTDNTFEWSAGAFNGGSVYAHGATVHFSENYLRGFLSGTDVTVA